MKELIYKEDARRAALHNEGDAVVAAIDEIKPVVEIDGYSLDRLLLFAEVCRKYRITEQDLKEFARNIEKAYGIIIQEMDEAWKSAIENMFPDWAKDEINRRDAQKVQDPVLEDIKAGRGLPPLTGGGKGGLRPWP